ncbi:MAG: hypothetical protein Q8N18_20105 [Opitutaceae bacterium]|nr:hypothetical protein [Opitutaceae bacterium]
MPEPRSAVLKDLVVEAEHVAIELNGRRILFRADPRSEAYESFRNLHEKIAASVAARVDQPAASGLFSRIGAFFKGLFSAGRDSGEQASPPAQRGSVWQGPQHSFDPDVRMQNGHAKEIFLDAGGMHVRWGENISNRTTETPSAQSTASVDLTFAPDSPVTEQLHRCFRELAKLGYAVPVVDAAIRSPVIVDPKSTEQAVASILSKNKDTVTESPGFQPSSATIEKSAVSPPGLAVTTGDTSQKIVETAGRDDASTAVTNGPRERKPVSKDLVTMRLRPELPDSPARGLVASVEAPESAEVLVAPELLLRALRASAALPPTSERRLTFLQCMRNENGMRIVNVGLGSNGKGQPYAWHDAATWWQTQGKDLATAAEAPSREGPAGATKISERTYVCGQSPLSVSAVIGSPGAEVEPASPTA